MAGCEGDNLGRESRKVAGPQFVQWFGPLLEALRRLGGSGTPDEVADQIASDLKLTDEKLNEVLPSGQSRYKNQVAWARFYLVREGLLSSSVRGVWSLTEQGRSTILTPITSLEIFSKWTKHFRQESNSEREASGVTAPLSIEGDQIEAPSHREQLLEVLLALPPEGFERLSQRLLRESGFVQVSVSGRSGDGGIDGSGMLQLNPFVSFRVLFQCKRYAGSVSPSQVRDFRGAMAGRADKGIIITTGTFTADAKREASRDGASPIELIDGERLVELMEKLQLGLKPITAYEIDTLFFDEFR